MAGLGCVEEEEDDHHADRSYGGNEHGNEERSADSDDIFYTEREAANKAARSLVPGPPTPGTRRDPAGICRHILADSSCSHPPRTRSTTNRREASKKQYENGNEQKFNCNEVNAEKTNFGPK